MLIIARTTPSPAAILNAPRIIAMSVIQRNNVLRPNVQRRFGLFGGARESTRFVEIEGGRTDSVVASGRLAQSQQSFSRGARAAPHSGQLTGALDELVSVIALLSSR